MGKVQNLLRDAAFKARALIERGLPEPDVFACLFNGIAGRIAAAGGLRPDGMIDLLFVNRALPKKAVDEIEALLDQPGLAADWLAEETLGWAYQYWQESARALIFQRLLKEKQKISPAEVPAATQLFTPAWIARFLTQNTLGRLWAQMHPGTHLVDRLDALVPLPDGAPVLPWKPVKKLRVLDPACGTMHFGLAAFDLLAEMYCEELERAGEPGWPQEPSVERVEDIPAAVLKHNLYGADIDARALALSRAALAIKAGKMASGGAVQMNLALLPGPLGSLARTAIPGQFDCIITNPPYMFRRSMEGALPEFLKKEYPAAKGDFYGAFILRCLELLAPGGRAGLITQASFLFLPSYSALREQMTGFSDLETLLHTGTRAFASVGGEKVNTAAFVLRSRQGEEVEKRRAVCFRLVHETHPDGKRRLFERSLAELRAGGQPDTAFCFQPEETRRLPGKAWVYWAAAGALRAFECLPDLRQAAGTDGNKTGENRRFIRRLDSLTLEEAASERWRRLARPARPEPYCQIFSQAVDWSPEARAFYHQNSSSSIVPERLAERAGISWSRITSRRFTARRFPPGVIPDVSTPAIYPEESESAVVVAIMNSIAGRYLLKIINPTLNNSLGAIRRLPIPLMSGAEKEQLRVWVEQLEAFYNADHLDRNAIEWVEAQVDELVFRLYEFSEEDIRAAREEQGLGRPRRNSRKNS